MVLMIISFVMFFLCGFIFGNWIFKPNNGTLLVEIKEDGAEKWSFVFNEELEQLAKRKKVTFKVERRGHGEPGITE